MVDLAVKIGKLRLANPVMVASGTFGEEYDGLMDMNKLGAIALKTVTLNARSGNKPPRIAESASGMLNSIGLENGGVEYFIKEKLPFYDKIEVPVIASISGDDENGFASLAKRLSRVKRINGIELNLSCPNIKYGNRGHLIAQDEEATFNVVRTVRRSTGLTIIAKLSPNVTDITKIAKAAEDAGADAVLLVNTFAALAVDIARKKPRLGNVTGGLSGPAIKPLALKMVWDACKKVKIPVIGCGGIMDYKDGIEFILCGATAFQIGTANFVNPNATSDIIDGIKKYMKMNNIYEIGDLIGALDA